MVRDLIPMPTKNLTTTARSTYRHGDLRRTLIAAGLTLARESGPTAVVLREVTRRAGVVPNAAYRHFRNRDALFSAVRAAALAAMARSMEDQLAQLGPPREDLAYAKASVRAVGTGYLRFARRETGMFRTAFAVLFDVEPTPDPEKAGESGLNPFQLLGAALDRLARCGGISAKRRSGAEHVAWSAVHGLAMLSIDGPLRRLPVKQFESLGRRLLDMVEDGLASPLPGLRTKAPLVRLPQVRPS
jgi:AcrR family transcriptional regulator